LHGAAPAPFGAIKRPLPCSPLELQFPQGRIAAAVAATESDRERGLMGVRRLPAGVGMLFVFDGDGVHEFWMKATLVPLDMVFVDSGGAVTSVAERVPATRPRTPDARIARRRGFGRYVIELGAGAAARLGLRPGARISIPAIPATP
ncbi:MAG: DUF192 domain-containing protein, partial [Candidatus Dormibacteria bacterium]